MGAPDRSNLLWTVVISIILLDAANMFSYGLPLNSYFQQYFGYSDDKSNSLMDTFNMVLTIFPLVGSIMADAFTGKIMLCLVAGWCHVLSLVIVLVSTLPMFGGFVSLGGEVNHIKEVLTQIGYWTLVSLASLSGGIVVALGGDQYDDHDPDEAKQKQSYFAWYYIVVQVGGLMSSFQGQIMSFNETWGPIVNMILAAVTFFIAQTVYTVDMPKFVERPASIKAVAAIPAVLGQALFRLITCANCEGYDEDDSDLNMGKSTTSNSGDAKLITKGMTTWVQRAATNYGGSFEPSTVEGVYQLVRMMPIFIVSCFAMVSYTQASTISVFQGQQMSGSSGAPGGGLQANTFQGVFDSLECLIYMYSIYKFVEPLSIKLLKFEITPIRKFTVGFVFMTLSMVAYGLIEIWRKSTPVISPVQIPDGDAIPVNALSQWWLLIPSNLMAIGESFFLVGQMEWFYDDAPDAYKAIMTAMPLLAQTIGNAVADIMLVVFAAWLPNNLNEGKYEYFMFVNAGMMVVATIFCQLGTWYYKKSGGSYQINVLRNGGSLFTDGSVDNTNRKGHHGKEEEVTKEASVLA